MESSENTEETLVILSNGKTFPRKTFSEYTKDELIEIIGCCRNYIDILNTLKLNNYYHRYLIKFVKENNVNTSHFRKSAPSTLASRLIKGNRHICGTDIKKYLITKNLVLNECSICKLPPIWNNKPLIFHLDHINGDHFDNRIENLRLLCPNCHTQTDTYTGKNTAKYKEKQCSECSSKLKRNNITGKCAKCITKEKNTGKCSECNVNDRFRTYLKCKECIKKQPEKKKCKVCNKTIIRTSNKHDYHMRCINGVEKDIEQQQPL